MGKREILAAAKRKGIVFDSVEWEWVPTPGESIPCWSISISEASQEKFYVDNFIQLGNTAEVLDWIEGIEPGPPIEDEDTHD